MGTWSGARQGTRRRVPGSIHRAPPPVRRHRAATARDRRRRRSRCPHVRAQRDDPRRQRELRAARGRRRCRRWRSRSCAGVSVSTRVLVPRSRSMERAFHGIQPREVPAGLSVHSVVPARRGASALVGSVIPGSLFNRVPDGCRPRRRGHARWGVALPPVDPSPVFSALWGEGYAQRDAANRGDRGSLTADRTLP